MKSSIAHSQPNFISFGQLQHCMVAGCIWFPFCFIARKKKRYKLFSLCSGQPAHYQNLSSPSCQDSHAFRYSPVIKLFKWYVNRNNVPFIGLADTILTNSPPCSFLIMEVICWRLKMSCRLCRRKLFLVHLNLNNHCGLLYEKKRNFYYVQAITLGQCHSGLVYPK